MSVRLPLAGRVHQRRGERQPIGIGVVGQHAVGGGHGQRTTGDGGVAVRVGHRGASNTVMVTVAAVEVA